MEMSEGWPDIYDEGYTYDWDDLCDHLRDVPWEDIFKLSASAAAIEFCEWVKVRIDPLTKFTSSIRSTEFKYILPWNISQMIEKTILISTRIEKPMESQWKL